VLVRVLISHHTCETKTSRTSTNTNTERMEHTHKNIMVHYGAPWVQSGYGVITLPWRLRISRRYNIIELVFFPLYFMPSIFRFSNEKVNALLITGFRLRQSNVKRETLLAQSATLRSRGNFQNAIETGIFSKCPLASVISIP